MRDVTIQKETKVERKFKIRIFRLVWCMMLASWSLNSVPSSHLLGWGSRDGVVNKKCGPLGCERTRLPPPPLPTGLMKFIKGKDNGNSPYFPSATRNSTSTDKAEAGGALILHPSLHQCTILRVFKATRKGKKSKQRFEVTPRNCIRKLPRTNPLCYMLVQLAELNVQRQWPSVYFTERGTNTLQYTDYICSFQPRVQ